MTEEEVRLLLPKYVCFKVTRDNHLQLEPNIDSDWPWWKRRYYVWRYTMFRHKCEKLRKKKGKIVLGDIL